jgi:4,5-dihydroxyphthalate decarboxylase
MTKLRISLAFGDYDRTRPLASGEVAIEGVDPVVVQLEPEEMFYRAVRHAEFDVTELSLSSLTLQTALGKSAYVGLPVFLSRAFRHTSVYIRRDRGIAAPADLRGRHIGTPEYQLTACVWARGLLADAGVAPGDVTWVRGGMEEAGRIEKFGGDFPGLAFADAPPGRTLSQMLGAGEIDGIIGPRMPSAFMSMPDKVGWLFPDPAAAASDYFRRTGVFPIMHVLAVRRSLVEAHPFLPRALFKAFSRAKALAMARLADTSAAKATLPFLEETLSAARALMGPDYWSYGIAGNERTLEAFLDLHHAQGLSPRRLGIADLFGGWSDDQFKI